MLHFRFTPVLFSRLRPFLAIAFLPLLDATCVTKDKDAQPNLPFQGMSYKANGVQVTVNFNELKGKYQPSDLTLLSATQPTSGGIVFSHKRFGQDSLYLLFHVPYLEVPDTTYFNQIPGNLTRVEHYTPGSSNTRNAQWYSRDYTGNVKTNYVIFDKVDGKERVAGRFEMILINKFNRAYPDTMRITEGRFNTFENIQQK